MKLAITFDEDPMVIKGGNSYVVRAFSAEKSPIAVKIYRGTAQRINTMLAREQRAITFLTECGLENVPKLTHVNQNLGVIAYSWIEGVTPNSDSKTMNAIFSMLHSLNQVFRRKIDFDNAIDAAFSISDVEAQIRRRLDEMNREEYFSLYPWINVELIERLNRYKKLFPVDISFNRRTLSMSDLGTHNILANDNSYYFIDFEFFGVDSIEKLVGDFIMHPRNEFSDEANYEFQLFFEHEFNLKQHELYPILPILALKWSLIALKREAPQSQLFQIRTDEKHILERLKSYQYLAYFDYLIDGYSEGSPNTFQKFAKSLG